MDHVKITCTFLFLLSFNLFAQDENFDFTQNMRNSNADFQTIVDNANQYYQTHTLTEVEGEGYSKFKRWEYFWNSRVSKPSIDHPGSFTKYLDAMSAIMNIDPVCPSTSGPSNWAFLGRSTNSPSPPPTIPNLGMIVSIAEDPSNPNTVYAGSTSGGLWKTTSFNSQPSWVNLTDQTHLAGLGIVWIAIDHNNPSVIYLATGLGWGHGGGYGVGILKTTDGGQTWVKKNPSTFQNFMVAQKIIIDPEDSNILYAIIYQSVFKSINGGTTWTTVFTLPNSVGQNPIDPNSPALFIRDIEFKPFDNTRLYISTDDAEPAIAAQTNTGAICFTSSNSGSTWSQMNIEAGGTNSPVIKLAVTPAEPNIIFASYGVSGITVIKKSSDQGITWTRVSSSSLIITDFGSQKNDIAISPTDPSVIYVAGRYVNKSINGGNTFTEQIALHVDLRTIFIHSGSTINTGGDNDTLITGNDGGVAYTSNGGSNWFDKNGTGLAISQYYGIGVSKDNKFLAGGMQDNSVAFLDLRNNSWFIPSLAQDGGDVLFDDDDPNLAYVQRWCCGLRSYDLYKYTYDGSNWVFNSTKVQPSYINTYPNRPMLKVNDNLYIGYHDIFKGPTPSLAWGLNSRISDFTSLGIDEPIISFDVSKSNPLCIYSLFPGPSWGRPPVGFFFKTTTGNNPWSDMTPSLPSIVSNNIKLTHVVIDPLNENRLWIGCGGLNDNGSAGPYNGAWRVIKSEYGGSTWIDYSNNLPQFPINDIVYEEGTNDGLYAATDIGVFYTNATIYPTQGWICFSNNFPSAMVFDLEINKCAGKLYAGTMGRGVWVTNLYPSPIEDITTSTTWTQAKNLYHNVVVKSGLTLTISASINIASGIKITVEPGAVLQLSGATLTNGCGEMWDGIYAQSGSYLYVTNSTIENAYKAFNLENNTGYTFTNNTFDKNFISINIGNNSGRTNVLGDITGNTFSCSGNLPRYFGTPIPGTTPDQTSLTSIFVTNTDYFTLGINGWNQNTIKDMVAGVISFGSNMVVTNTLFQNISLSTQYQSYGANSLALVNGSAIFSRGNGSYNLSISGPNLKINNCYRGVSVYDQNFSITNCDMTGVSGGIGTTYGIIAAMCVNKTGYIATNTIESTRQNINLYSNDNVASIQVASNTLRVGIGGGLNITNTDAFSIGVMENHSVSSSRRINLILNNIEVHYGIIGIYMNSANHVDAISNSISLLHDNNNTQTPGEIVRGFSINNCTDASINRNTVTGTNSNSSSTQYGFELNINSGAPNLVVCNTASNTKRNFYFGGGNSTTQLLGNTIGDGYEGLYIASSSFIGPQIHTGNCFSGSFGNPIGAAINNNANVIVVRNSRFTVNQSLCYWPSHNWGIDFFVSDNGQAEYSCTGPIGVGGGGGCDIEPIDETIVEGDFGSTMFNEETQWEGKKYLFEKLNLHPEIKICHEEFEDFYSRIENSNIDQLVQVESSLRSINQFPENDSIQYSNNDSLIQNHIGDISELNLSYVQTNDSSIRASIGDEIQNSVDQLRGLNNSNNEILESFIVSRNNQVNSVNIENNSISTTEFIESNLQQANNIYLSTIAIGNSSFTEEQKQVLHDISVQCPYAGGPGVYQARSLYSMINNQVAYNDYENCAQLGYYRLKNNKNEISKQNTTKIIPNPVQNKAKLLYQLPYESKGTCNIYNTNGSLILSNNLLSNSKYFEFDTENLKSGIYHYQVLSDGNYIGSGNFAVVK